MKVSEKRKLKKIAIMETALEVWARDNFHNTSLSSLETPLGMTKQALYRYFSGKEDLLDSIQDYISSINAEMNRELIEKLEILPREKRIRYYLEHHSRFFRTHPYYIRFDSYTIMKTGEFNPRFEPGQMANLETLLGLSGKELHLLLLYANFMWGWHETDHLRIKRTEKQKTDLIIELLENGLGTDSFHPPEVGIHLQNDPEYQEYRKSVECDNLFQSVSGAIQEQGFDGVTLENIAEKAGISKSTLYNYFRNKDEMLTKTINLLVREYMTFHTRLLNRYGTFEEKLLAHLELQCATFPDKPQSFIIMKQFMGRNVLDKIDKPVDDPDFLHFLEEGLKENKLKNLLSPLEYQMIFSFFIFIEKVIYRLESSEDFTPQMIQWLRLLARGIQRT